LKALTFDHPLAIRREDAEFGCGSNAAIDQHVAGRKPDLATPRARADGLAKSQALETFAECLTIRCGEFIAENHQVAAECVLHVPVGAAADALRPVHP